MEENKQITIQIKSIFEEILFEYTKLNNTAKDTLEIAVKSNANLKYADLFDADLSNADLSNANLSNANLRYTNLSNADLSNANLYNADLRYTNLSNADLYNANLRYADLFDADLSNADLSNTDLSNANLRYANLFNVNLSNANLRYADLDEKEKLRKGVIIDKPVRVFKKCRTNKAKVISINGKCEKGLKCCSSYNYNFIYEVGKTLEVKDFDLMYNVECSSGIHFFWTKEEAEDYNL